MRAFVVETVSGRFVHELEVKSWRYDSGILAPDAAEVQVPAYTRRAREMRVERILVPYRHSVVLLEDTLPGVRLVPVAGVLRSFDFVSDADGLDYFRLDVYGVECLLEHRQVARVPGFPLVGSNGKPLTTYDVSFKGLQYGTIMKRLVQEALRWPGGGLPIVFEADRSGSREKSYKAIDGKPVREALQDLSELDAGVEFDFVPVLDEVSDALSYRFVTGSDSGRRVVPRSDRVWELGGSSSYVGGLTRKVTGPSLWSQAVFTGGKDEDRVLAARAVSSRLTGLGFPFLALWDSSHVTVSRDATLQAYADGAVSGAGLLEEWECSVRFDEAPDLRHGEWVDFRFSGSSVLPDGVYRRRVLSVTRESSSPGWLKVQLIGVGYGEVPT